MIVIQLLLRAVTFGLGPVAASAYAGLPSDLVHNWLARGAKLSLDPFDVSSHDDPAVRKHLCDFHKKVGVPCLFLFTEWRKAKAAFTIKCINKIVRSKDWKAQAWLLERQDPSRFAAPSRSLAIKRDSDIDEKIIEADIVDPTDDDAPKVLFYCPDNNRGTT